MPQRADCGQFPGERMTSDDAAGTVVWEWGEDRVPSRRIILGNTYNVPAPKKDPKNVVQTTLLART